MSIVAPPMFGAFFCAIIFDDEIPTPRAECMAVWIEQVRAPSPKFAIFALLPINGAHWRLVFWVCRCVPQKVVAAVVAAHSRWSESAMPDGRPL